jgi:hypothetical protein
VLRFGAEFRQLLDESGDGQRDAAKLANRLSAAGIEAVLTYPASGKDFNDALLGASNG